MNKIEAAQIELAQYRLEKAREKIKAAEGMMSICLYGEVIGRSYYAIFSSARALLALLKLDSKKHSGVISFFNQYWVKTGILPKNCSVILKDAKSGREASDYDDYVEFEKEDAENQLKQAKRFVSMIESTIAKIVASDIELPEISCEKCSDTQLLS